MAKDETDRDFRHEMEALDRLAGLIPGERPMTADDVIEMLDRTLKRRG